MGATMSRMADTPGKTPVSTLVAFVMVKHDSGRIDELHWLSVVQGERRLPRPGTLMSGAAQTWNVIMHQPLQRLGTTTRPSRTSQDTHTDARQDRRRDGGAGLVGIARRVALEAELHVGGAVVAGGEDVGGDDADLEGSDGDLEERGGTHFAEESRLWQVCE